MFFRRADFRTLPVAPVKPAVSARVRYWDRAATEARPGADPDWTVGVLMSRTVDGLFVIEHVIRAREEPAGVYRLIKSTAAADHAADADTWQVLEQEPGSSGKADAQAIARELAGCNVRIVAPSGDKVTRAKPLSAQAAVGNCAIVGAVWNLSFLDELESFPKGHDDQVDAASGAFNQLAPMNGMKPRTGGVRPLARAQGGF
jgi:predicted phage terminase large subunit-like protein